MKKYKVLRRGWFTDMGEVLIATEYGEIPLRLDENTTWMMNKPAVIQAVKNGWLAEVLEEKELWEKLMGVEPNEIYYAASEKYWKDKSKIASQHFAEVARKAEKEWTDLEVRKINRTEYIIQAIEKDGEA